VIATSTSRDTTIQSLAAIWAEVLGVKDIGTRDNFFALGGHSLLAVKLVAAVQERLHVGSELTPSSVSEFPTIEQFADHLQVLAASDEVGEI
jgi:acyl carrier protein